MWASTHPPVRPPIPRASCACGLEAPVVAAATSRGARAEPGVKSVQTYRGWAHARSSSHAARRQGRSRSSPAGRAWSRRRVPCRACTAEAAGRSHRIHTQSAPSTAYVRGDALCASSRARVVRRHMRMAAAQEGTILLDHARVHEACTIGRACAVWATKATPPPAPRVDAFRRSRLCRATQHGGPATHGQQITAHSAASPVTYEGPSSSAVGSAGLALQISALVFCSLGSLSTVPVALLLLWLVGLPV